VIAIFDCDDSNSDASTGEVNKKSKMKGCVSQRPTIRAWTRQPVGWRRDAAMSEKQGQAADYQQLDCSLRPLAVGARRRQRLKKGQTV
jgi:hypothetical protein